MNRFWDKVDKSGECWEWTGARSSYGHGNIKVDGRALGAHRVALELDGVDIPSGMVVRHSCDNPGCVNPDHLELGSQGDNIQDMHDRGRHKINNGSRFNIKTAEKIRRSAADGTNQADLAEHYGVSRQYINDIVRNRKWAREV